MVLKLLASNQERLQLALLESGTFLVALNSVHGDVTFFKSVIFNRGAEEMGDICFLCAQEADGNFRRPSSKLPHAALTRL